MHPIRRLTLSSLVAAAATLAACSDAPTSAREAPDSPVVAAANANAGPEARVARVGASAQMVAQVVARGTLNATGKNFTDPPTEAVIYNCPAVMPSEAGSEVASAYYNCFEPIDPVDPPPPTDPCAVSYCPSVQANWGSDATPVSIIPGTTLKTLQLISFSQAISNVGFTTLDASFKNVGAQWSCYNTAQAFDSSHASGYGSPLYLQTSREPAWQGIIRWQVDGTHGFSPVSGATGGGTFWSSDFTCG